MGLCREGQSPRARPSRADPTGSGSPRAPAPATAPAERRPARSLKASRPKGRGMSRQNAMHRDYPGHVHFGQISAADRIVGAHPMVHDSAKFDAPRPSCGHWKSGRPRSGQKFRDRKRLFRLEIKKFQKCHAFDQNYGGQNFFRTRVHPAFFNFLFPPQPSWGRVRTGRMSKSSGCGGHKQACPGDLSSTAQRLGSVSCQTPVGSALLAVLHPGPTPKTLHFACGGPRAVSRAASGCRAHTPRRARTSWD